MKESGFQTRIVTIAKMYGWKVWHVPAPMKHTRRGTWVGATEAAGLPDLILIHQDPPRLVFLELKAENGKLSDKQQEFLQAAKMVAEASDLDQKAAINEYGGDFEPLIGVVAAWPKDESAIEQMLRTRCVA